jgi:hypothetical protein
MAVLEIWQRDVLPEARVAVPSAERNSSGEAFRKSVSYRDVPGPRRQNSVSRRYRGQSIGLGSGRVQVVIANVMATLDAKKGAIPEATLNEWRIAARRGLTSAMFGGQIATNPDQALSDLNSGELIRVRASSNHASAFSPKPVDGIAQSARFSFPLSGVATHVRRMQTANSLGHDPVTVGSVISWARKTLDLSQKYHYSVSIE